MRSDDEDGVAAWPIGTLRDWWEELGPAAARVTAEPEATALKTAQLPGEFALVREEGFQRNLSFSYAFAFSFAFGWGVFNSGFGARLAEAHNRSSSYRRSTDCGALKTTAAAIGVFAGRIQGTTGSLARQGNETSIRNEYEYGEAENGSELGNLHDGELVRFGMAGENIWSQSSAI